MALTPVQWHGHLHHGAPVQPAEAGSLKTRQGAEKTSQQAPQKNELARCLDGLVEPAIYLKWLKRKAVAHGRPDKERGNVTATNKAWASAIHEAMIQSGGRGVYAGELLDWSRPGRYNNDASRMQGGSARRDWPRCPRWTLWMAGRARPIL